jgi:hypothetical protein
LKFKQGLQTGSRVGLRHSIDRFLAFLHKLIESGHMICLLLNADGIVTAVNINNVYIDEYAKSPYMYSKSWSTLNFIDLPHEPTYGSTDGETWHSADKKGSHPWHQSV